ncbi:nitroreductase family protein [Tessaracoccus oleiagri]|uniref:nitroreductase family protein n=1 Tax=Tessaracoccus oleiagri TaxID=686624 RepID=UPI0015A05CEF|nr:nitroreductase family protein [Tessaracoccus oleiagri]
MSEIFDEVTLAYAESSSDDLAGVTVLEGSSKKDNGVKNFKALFEGRYSVREFADGPLSVERILPALNLSRKAPSVCNRQASRVKIVTDAVLIDKVLKIQGGMTGYATPPALLVVTTDLAAFLEPTERNQPFIDGGIYTMALLLALEHEELAACPLNAMMTGRNEDRVKSLLGIPVSERLIVFLAVGEFPRSVKVPMSFRLPVDDVVRLPVDDVVSHISE